VRFIVEAQIEGRSSLPAGFFIAIRIRFANTLTGEKKLGILKPLKLFSRILLVVGVGLIAFAFLWARNYHPKWSPPEGGGSEYFDGTALERFIFWASWGSALVAISRYLGNFGQPRPVAGAQLRTWGVVLCLAGVALIFLPIFSALPYFVAGAILFLIGATKGRKTPGEQTKAG
jgi:hypothetical protein